MYLNPKDKPYISFLLPETFLNLCIFPEGTKWKCQKGRGRKNLSRSYIRIFYRIPVVYTIYRFDGVTVARSRRVSTRRGQVSEKRYTGVPQENHHELN